MGRRRDVSGVKRPIKFELSIDQQLKNDLAEIGKAWDVPTSTTAYWLLRGLVAEARSDSFVVMGDSLSEKLAKFLLNFSPKPEKKNDKR